MTGALGVSTLFLFFYLLFHFEIGFSPFPGTGIIRVIYFVILVPHIIMAIIMLPLVLCTVYFAVKKQITRHRRLVRWTLPVWLYVSVTGVVIYWMNYHLVDRI